MANKCSETKYGVRLWPHCCPYLARDTEATDSGPALFRYRERAEQWMTRQGWPDDSEPAVVRVRLKVS